jgi:hypothetical protein
MTVIRQDADNSEQEFREAAEWEAGVAVRKGTNEIGFGFHLWDENRNPIASCLMTPEQAFAQGRYLVENAARMLGLPEPVIVMPHVDFATKLAERISAHLNATFDSRDA